MTGIETQEKLKDPCELSDWEIKCLNNLKWWKVEQEFKDSFFDGNSEFRKFMDNMVWWDILKDMDWWDKIYQAYVSILEKSWVSEIPTKEQLINSHQKGTSIPWQWKISADISQQDDVEWYSTPWNWAIWEGTNQSDDIG